MATSKKRALVEGLLFAGAMGLLALCVALVGMLEVDRRSAFDKESIASLAKRPISSKTVASRTGSGTRVFRIGGKGEPLFGLVLPLRDSRGSSMIAALFAPDGRLEAARLLYESPSSREASTGDWLADLVGRGGSSPYPASKREAPYPEAVSGATESFLAATSALGEASEAVRRAAQERP